MAVNDTGRQGVEIDAFIKSEREYFAPMQDRARRFDEQQRIQWRKETVSERQKRVSLEVYDALGGTVRYGPFAGMQLSRATWWGGSDLGAQCLGLYEPEISEALLSLSAAGSGTFIDIGAADGYYTTGMLVSGLARRAICYELSDFGREAIEENWRNNGAPGELEIYGEATESSIGSLKPEDLVNSLVLVDIEGAEFCMFTDSVFAALKTSSILLEVHNWVSDFDNLYADLLRRANEHFHIDVIPRREAGTLHLPELRDFTDDNRLLLQSERRPCVMRFLKFTPRG